MRPHALLRLLALLFGASSIQASCDYSPPPLLSQGQGADTLGRGRLSAGVEGGYGTSASWWQAQGLADPDVSHGVVGAGRLRLGLFEDLDVGLVGAAGPDRSFAAGPEVKWRIAQYVARREPGQPGFHAAFIFGLAAGAADYHYVPNPVGPLPRHVFIAPYEGITASGGIELVHMYTGLRLAESQTLGHRPSDLTLYPVLAFGVELRPVHALAFFAETDLAGGLTLVDGHDAAVIFYPSAGLSLAFDVFGTAPPRE